VKTPVQGVIVLSLAFRAHLEATHGGLRAVVGDILNDSEAGPAVGAVSKGIVVASIDGGEDFLLAGLTGGDVR
jgi:hypothetical protein